eukprot:812933-Pyramimonas_sp.AAC.1
MALPATAAFSASLDDPRYGTSEGTMLWKVNATIMIGNGPITAGQLARACGGGFGGQPISHQRGVRRVTNNPLRCRLRTAGGVDIVDVKGNSVDVKGLLSAWRVPTRREAEMPGPPSTTRAR